MKVFLIRHPEPVGAGGLCYGRTDLLVDPAVAQAAAAQMRPLLSGQLDAVITSPLRRCTALAALLADTYMTDDRLAELDFGCWEAVRWADIDRAAFDQWAADYVRRPVPGGESWADVRRRAGDFLAGLRTQSFGTAVVVSHAGVLRALLALVLGTQLEATWRIRLSFGAVATVEIGPDAQADRLIALTDTTAH